MADYLIQNHNFTQLYIDRPCGTPALEKRQSITTSLASVSLTPSISNETKSFSNAEVLIDFVTSNWQNNYVTTSLWSQSILDILSHRPFFILISVDAPVTVRWQRYQTKRSQMVNTSSEPVSLEKFVLLDDEHMYDPLLGLATLSSQARLKLLNSTTSISSLHNSLVNINLTDESRLRPNWDQYFMKLANLAAQRSNCMKRQVGCVIVRDKRVISTGYNGTPRNITNCNQGGCDRCNCGGRGIAALSMCLCVHAEANALLEAGRERVGEDATLYCNTCPCLTCSIKIVQVGIREVVFTKTYKMDVQVCRTKRHFYQRLIARHR